MKKNCSRYPPASRADTGTSMSCRSGCRNHEFRLESDDTETDGTDEAGECVFLMNRFYGEKTIRPMIECVQQEFAGDIGLAVANRLEKEMQGKNGCLRGDALLELLKDELGLECAVSLIGQMDCFKKMGLYGDRIMACLPKPSEPLVSFPDKPDRQGQPERAAKGCAGSEKGKGTCQGGVPERAGKEKANWKTNSKTK